MFIKSILCIYGGAPFEMSALTLAMKLASDHKAEAKFLHIAVPLNAYPELYGLALYGSAVTGDSEFLSKLAETNGEMRAEALARIEACAMQYGVAMEVSADANAACASFQSVSTRPRDYLSLVGPACDLIVAGRDDPEAIVDLDAILAGLFDASRPILVVPKSQDEAFGPRQSIRKVAVAWDGSKAATRALHAAIPLIGRAQVELLRVGKASEPHSSDADAALLHWLGRHGIQAGFVQVDHEDSTVSEAILARADAVGADLLVMGAYGHSHIGEMILGGVTNHVLKHARLPLFLSH